MKLLYSLLLVLNGLSFFLMGLDKSRARRKMRRIPEKTLFLSALLFGALGGCLGMFLFRHKTLHSCFRIGFPLLFLAQLLFVFLVS